MNGAVMWIRGTTPLFGSLGFLSRSAASFSCPQIYILIKSCHLTSLIREYWSVHKWNTGAPIQMQKKHGLLNLSWFFAMSALYICFLKLSMVPVRMWFNCSSSKCRRNIDLIALEDTKISAVILVVENEDNEGNMLTVFFLKRKFEECESTMKFIETLARQIAAGVVQTTAASRCASKSCIFTNLTSKGSSCKYTKSSIPFDGLQILADSWNNSVSTRYSL